MASVYSRDFRADHGGLAGQLAETCAIAIRERLLSERVDPDAVDRMSVTLDLWLDGMKILSRDQDLYDVAALPVASRAAR